MHWWMCLELQGKITTSIWFWWFVAQGMTWWSFAVILMLPKCVLQLYAGFFVCLNTDQRVPDHRKSKRPCGRASWQGGKGWSWPKQGPGGGTSVYVDTHTHSLSGIHVDDAVIQVWDGVSWNSRICNTTLCPLQYASRRFGKISLKAHSISQPNRHTTLKIMNPFQTDRQKAFLHFLHFVSNSEYDFMFICISKLKAQE